MCLDTIFKTNTAITEGYKVFGVKKFGKRLRLFSDLWISEIPYPRRRWIEDPKAGNLIGFYPKKYPAGFHFFESLDDARIWAYFITNRIFKIKVQNVVASGTQARAGESLRVHVATKMLIQEEINPKE